MTILAHATEARTWAIRSGVTTVIVMTMFAVSARPSKIEMPHGFEEDPLTVVRIFNDNVNAKMIDGALGLVDDNVIFIDATGQAHDGKAFVRNWMQAEVQENDKSEISDLWISGNTVTWTARISSGDPLELETSEAVVQNGKIKSLKVLGPQ